MNAKNKNQLIREAMSTLLHGYKLNTLITQHGESWDHFFGKATTFYELRQAGKQIVTEAPFKTGGRADIINLTDQEIIEIMVTETLEEAKEKTKKYPSNFTIRFVKVEK